MVSKPRHLSAPITEDQDRRAEVACRLEAIAANSAAALAERARLWLVAM
jgi:hypothetical protein